MKKLKALGVIGVISCLTLGMMACGKEDAAVSSNDLTNAPVEESPNVITGDVENAVIAPTGTYKSETGWVVLYDDGTGYLINQEATKIESYIAGAFVMGDLTYVYKVDGESLSITVDGNEVVYTKTTESLPADVAAMIEQ